MVNIKESVADLIFVMKAPMDGVEQALEEASALSKAWNRIKTLMNYVNIPYLIPKGGYRKELLSIAYSFFSAGSDPGTTFMALFNRYNQLVQERISYLNMALVAVIVISIMVSVLGVMTILGAPSIMGLISIVLIPLIHEFQVEITRYNYTKPVIGGSIGLALGLALGLFFFRQIVVELALIGLGLGFAVLYIPQFVKFLRDYSTMYDRVMSSFDELLHGPGAEFKPRLPLEHEIKPLWDFAFSIGSREVIERVIMLVGTYLNYVRSTILNGLIYGPFVSVSFAFTLFIAYLMLGLNVPTLPVAFTVNPHAIADALLPMAVATALTTGKAMHSIGLGIALLPIFVSLVLIV